jgi:hypothetical protein
MLVADKAVAIFTALDKTNADLGQIIRGLNYDPRTYAVLINELERLYGGAEAEILLASQELFKGPKVAFTSLDSVRSFRVKLAAYRTTLETHGQRVTEFSPNSHLYREITAQKFTPTDMLHFQEQRVARNWKASPDGLLAWLDLRQSALEATDIGVRTKPSAVPTAPPESLSTAFMTTDVPEVYSYAVHATAIDATVFCTIDEDTPSYIVEQLLSIRHDSGNQDYICIVPCEWKGKECSTSHLLRDFSMFKAKTARGQLEHLRTAKRCFNCMKKGQQSRECTSSVKCIKCKGRHNYTMHGRKKLLR